MRNESEYFSYKERFRWEMGNPCQWVPNAPSTDQESFFPLKGGRTKDSSKSALNIIIMSVPMRFAICTVLYCNLFAAATSSQSSGSEPSPMEAFASRQGVRTTWLAKSHDGS